MKILYQLIIVFMVLQLTFSEEDKIPLNETPMYGSKDGNYILKEHDKKFIKELVDKLGSIDAAYHECIKRSWQFYNNKDYKMAIVRANQAWLFKKDDYEVYYLFGLATSSKSYINQTKNKINLINDAISYFILSLKYNEKHAVSYANIGRLCRDLVFSYYQFKIKVDSNQINELMLKSKQFLEKSLNYASKDDEFGYIYYQLAIQNAMLGEYKKAWECIYLVKKYKCNYLIEKGFIEKLDEDYPDPGE
jgi:tetratricopeptide (TPR) repeat protein